jgi:hypothetical protein
LRVDTTYPEILDLALLRVVDGVTEIVPVLYAGSPLLGQLDLNGVLSPGEGFTFLADPDLQNMQLYYGLYDPESGILTAKYLLTETTFDADYATYQRTL